MYTQTNAPANDVPPMLIQALKTLYVSVKERKIIEYVNEIQDEGEKDGKPKNI